MQTRLGREPSSQVDKAEFRMFLCKGARQSPAQSLKELKLKKTSLQNDGWIRLNSSTIFLAKQTSTLQLKMRNLSTKAQGYDQPRAPFLTYNGAALRPSVASITNTFTTSISSTFSSGCAMKNTVKVSTLLRCCWIWDVTLQNFLSQKLCKNILPNTSGCGSELGY